MSPHTNRQYTEAQRREAADWFVIINAENEPSTDNLQGWLRWMDAEESNRIAFESVAQAWHSTPALPRSFMPSEQELLGDNYDAEASVAEWNSALAQNAAGAAPCRGGRARGGFHADQWTWLVAASMAGLILGGGGYMWHLRTAGMQRDEFATRTAEQIQITLADGSRVWLGPKSRLLVGFAHAQRDLQLIAGEAFFSVKKDSRRPFVVHSEGGDITAVGTEFNVRNVDHNVLLTVSEGVVTVRPGQQTESASQPIVRVASGEQVSFTAENPATTLRIRPSAARGERARWREGILVYRDEPLSSVIKDISRYRATPIDIPEPIVGELRYSGVLYINALDEWLTALPESFPIRIVSHDGKEEIRQR